MQFGGITAPAAVELTVEPGTVHGLIGPNGAGKTTLLNVLSGFYRPTSGRITLGDRDITGYSPHRIARAGIARTFQTTQLFGAMTVVDNVQVGLAGEDNGWLVGALAGVSAVGHREAQLRTDALALLDFVAYAGNPDEIAANLPFGVKRLVEIARALARRPVALLLDEPAAGLAQGEIAGLAALIAKIRESGTAVLLVVEQMAEAALELLREHLETEADDAKRPAEQRRERHHVPPRIVRISSGVSASAAKRAA